MPFHQGVVAAVRPHPILNEKDLDQILAETPDALLLALDQVTDPHNLGACIRTAAAMGVQAVIVPRDRSASLTPTARKVAAGGAEKVKFIQVKFSSYIGSSERNHSCTCNWLCLMKVHCQSKSVISLAQS